MKQLFLCFIALSMGFLSPAKAQKNAQGKVLYAIMEELSTAFGEESLQLMRRIKTEAQFAHYMRMKAKGCPSCPMLQEFTKGLSAPARKPNVVPQLGAKPQKPDSTEVQLPPISNNFGHQILLYYEYNIYGVDNSSQLNGVCGPLYGLSRWGCPLPCTGFCPRDPISVPGGDEEDYDEDYGEDYDEDYDSGEEEEFNYDDYQPADADYDYEYDPNQ